MGESDGLVADLRGGCELIIECFFGPDTPGKLVIIFNPSHSHRTRHGKISSLKMIFRSKSSLPMMRAFKYCRKFNRKVNLKSSQLTKLQETDWSRGIFCIFIVFLHFIVWRVREAFQKEGQSQCIQDDETNGRY